MVIELQITLNESFSITAAQQKDPEDDWHNIYKSQNNQPKNDADKDDFIKNVNW